MIQKSHGKAISKKKVSKTLRGGDNNESMIV